MPESFPSRVSLFCFLTLLLVALGLLLWMSEPFLLAVFAGQLLALASEPLYRGLLAGRLKPRLAALVVTSALLVLLILPIFVLGVLAAHQGARMAQDLQGRELSLNGIELFVRPLAGLSPQARALIPAASQALQGAAKAIGELTVQILKALPEILLDSALALFSCFYLLLTGDRFIDQAAALLPLDGEVRSSVVEAFKRTAELTVWASLASACAHCALVGLAFLILGVPAALFAAAATFVLAWIPIIGSSPVWIAGGLYLLANGWHGRFVAMTILAFAGAVIDHSLRPMILRGRARIPALIALVAILGGLRVFGLFGVFLGPVLAAELLTLLELWPVVGRRYGLDLSESVNAE